MREDYKPSHIWVSDKKMITFDTLIVRNGDCEGFYTAFGDSAHIIQSAYRFVDKNGVISNMAKSHYALHCGELEPMVRKSAKEVVAFLDGKIVYHTIDLKEVDD